MESNKLTPAQAYMQHLIDALTNIIENPDDTDWQDEVLMQILQRPKTLRAALAAALYKSKSAAQYRY